MDMRVIGGGAAAAVFGMGSLTYVGLDDVLGEVEPIAAIAPTERQAYMDGVVATLNDAYDHAMFETETYVFVGDVSFKGDASTLTFSEIIRSEDAIDAADRGQIASDLRSVDKCNSADTLMFTNQGWDYAVTVRDGAGTLIMSKRCRAQTPPPLRALSS